MSRLNVCKLCGGLPRIDKFKPPLSAWVYLVECSSKDCDSAEFGETPEEAARLWNFANPDWDGNGFLATGLVGMARKTSAPTEADAARKNHGHLVGVLRQNLVIISPCFREPRLVSHDMFKR
jgi:hypothetical protein